MPWFRCLIRGENFPDLMLTPEKPLVGFYTYRWVEAANEEEAEIAVLDLLRKDPKLQRPEAQPKPKDAMVYIDEIVEVRKPRRQNTAFVFF